MKIVHLVPSYFPFFSGGSGYSLYRLNENLNCHKKIVISEGLHRKKIKATLKFQIIMRPFS